jgi:hypothetical protein
MSYSNFTLSKVKADFGIVTNETQDLFAKASAIAPSELLTISDYSIKEINKILGILMSTLQPELEWVSDR